MADRQVTEEERDAINAMNLAPVTRSLLIEGKMVSAQQVTDLEYKSKFYTVWKVSDVNEQWRTG